MTNSVHEVALYLTATASNVARADALVADFLNEVKGRLGDRIVLSDQEDKRVPFKTEAAASQDRGTWDYRIFCKVRGDSAKEVDRKVEFTVETVMLNMGGQLEGLEVNSVEVDK
jgi:hypothetical protein